jgi:signal transduction histidine kinase
MFGITDKEEYFAKWKDLVPEFQPDGTLSSDLLAKNMKIALETGRASFEWILQKIDGTPIPGESTIIRVLWRGEESMAVFVRDLTDVYKHREMQEDLLSKLKASVESEQAANLAKSKFLSNMSHEIRTPMSAIIGMTSIAKNTDDIAKKDDSIHKIEKASKHLLGIVNQILDMSKIEAESFELDSHSFSFETMIDEVVSIFSLKIDEKRLTLDVSLDNAIPRFILSDGLRLAQVVTNLLANAIKFTPEGGKISLAATLIKPENFLRVAITDNGIGIPKETQANLFTAFVQAEMDMSRKYGGTGLGLSISKWIIEKMGGSIFVESAPGEGSCFSFEIPVIEGEAPAEFAPEVDILTGSCKDYTILIAEDVDINREIICAMLEPTGAKIECAEDGNQALQMFRHAPERYDIIFMDVQMPVMDGITATRLIREISKNIPIVAMTANAFQEDISACLEAGMNDHLSKPLDYNRMMSKLQSYLHL